MKYRQYEVEVVEFRELVIVTYLDIVFPQILLQLRLVAVAALSTRA